MLKICVQLTINGDHDAAQRAVDNLLDDGLLQTAIDEYDCDEGPLQVVSAIVTTVESVDEEIASDDEISPEAEYGEATERDGDGLPD